ncbi:hypothetical protein KUTeg_001329 [Tegillarca granosa]|uniref:Endoglucanase n=1 Tax=Tegillarca granosa TaxID=220873 RepID=A0ABQ9FST5_TEGGR|nr:hypothetical protein KUTeg_001329 [Tegillarca granosa]
MTQAYETYETLNIVGSWHGGYDTSFSLHPTKIYNGWCIHIVLDQPVDCVLMWRAKLVNSTRCKGNREFLAVNEWFDRQLQPGHQEDFRLQVWHSYDHTVNGRVYLKDSCYSCLYSSNLPEYVSTGGLGYEKCTGKKSPTTTTTTTTTTGPTYTVNVTTAVYNQITKPPNVTTSTGQTIYQTGSTTLAASPMSYVSKSVTDQAITPLPFSHVDVNSTTVVNLTQGQVNKFTALQGVGQTVLSHSNISFGGQPLSEPNSSHGFNFNNGNGNTRYNYSKALELSILFYDSQRSGKLPTNNTIPWRSDSATNDSDHGIDLTGGWYDAGDYMKFNFPMSASTTNLLWGLEKWKDGYKDAGDGSRDHAYTGRPEDMHMKRPSYKVTASKPGSDVAGETAASLAAGSIIQITRRNYSMPLGVSINLQKATEEFTQKMLLYEITGEDKYKHDVESFVKSYLPGGNVSYTPCGLAFVNEWGPLRYSANAAFIALLAVENGIGDGRYKQFATSQINYMLGDNNKNISYEIGFGGHYPKHPYHRSSLYNNAVLKGALVAGPDKNDNYQDKQDDYQKNEVACDYNAGFQSVLAGLIHFAHNGLLPVSPPAKC